MSLTPSERRQKVSVMSQSRSWSALAPVLGQRATFSLPGLSSGNMFFPSLFVVAVAVAVVLARRLRSLTGER